MRSWRLFAAAMVVVLFSVCASKAFARPNSRGSSSASSNIYIHQSANPPRTQVILLQDYTGKITATSIVDKATQQPITLRNPPNCYGAVNTSIWYFMLGPRQTAQITNYVQTPVHLAVWAPVDSSAKGQDPSTCWFDNGCFSYPFTYGAPSTATPAGATFAELNVSNSIFDTADISEVNGVNAAWTIRLPGPWSNSAYMTPQKTLIPVSVIKNNPGSSPNFYGDYGNPGVYPFGCTNCASRYQNLTTPASPPGTQRSGCLAAESQAPVTYPTNDVGCDNAVNYYPTNANTEPPVPPANRVAPLAGYQNAPPGVMALPFDKYFDPQYKKQLYNIGSNPPVPFVGYGICNIVRGAAGAGGDIDIELSAYPFGQIQGAQ